MLEEVESIIKQVSLPDMDLDHMVTKVEKGYSLIQSMRERLNETKEKIDQLHQRFDETSSQ